MDKETMHWLSENECEVCQSQGFCIDGSYCVGVVFYLAVPTFLSQHQLKAPALTLALQLLV